MSWLSAAIKYLELVVREGLGPASQADIEQPNEQQNSLET